MQTGAFIFKPAGVFRRVAALLYDSFVILALFIIATLLVLLFNGHVAIKPYNPYYSLYLLSIWFSFYALFWLKRGQTVGMLAWGLRLQNCDGGVITFKQALLRFIAAFPAWLCLGLGIFWLWLDREHCTWQDKVSRTRIIRIIRSNRV